MNFFSENFKYTILILFFCSCINSKVNKSLIRVEMNDPINNAILVIQEQCYKTKHPQFLANFIIDDSILLPLEIEGAWEENFNLLQANFIGPLGEEYFSFQMNKNILNYNKYSKSLDSNNSLNQISSLMKMVGAKGLRNFLCGQFAFQILNKNDGVFLVKENNEKDKYFTISTIEIDDNNIEVQSSISLTKNKNGYALIINSRFYYGIFSTEAPIEVKWIGFISEKELFPTSLFFKTKENNFQFNFTEFQ